MNTEVTDTIHTHICKSWLTRAFTKKCASPWLRQRGRQDSLLSDQQLRGRSFDRNVSGHTAPARILRTVPQDTLRSSRLRWMYRKTLLKNATHYCVAASLAFLCCPFSRCHFSSFSASIAESDSAYSTDVTVAWSVCMPVYHTRASCYSRWREWDAISQGHWCDHKKHFIRQEPQLLYRKARFEGRNSHFAAMPPNTKLLALVIIIVAA